MAKGPTIYVYMPKCINKGDPLSTLQYNMERIIMARENNILWEPLSFPRTN